MNNNILGRRAAAVAAVAMGLSAPAWGVQDAKLLPDDGQPFDEFGAAVALSGDRAVVGAPREDEMGDSAGAAYVFEWSGTEWVEMQKLLAHDGFGDDRFGCSVSISGDVVLVGSRCQDEQGDNSGAAYAYRWNGASWVEEQKIMPSDGAEFDDFGVDVVVEGDVALIAADNEDETADAAGAAYIFRYDGKQWIEEQKLLASDGEPFDVFGRSVDLSGDVALIGASGRDEADFNVGAMYVFRYDGKTWVEEQKLTAADAEESDGLGLSVSLSGDVALGGAFGEDERGSGAGAAYVFRFDGDAWAQEQKLMASDGDAGDFYGRAVAASADGVIVGAWYEADYGTGAGSAYVYRFNGTDWIETGKLNAYDADAGDLYGSSVEISDGYALVGAHFEDANGQQAGAAYVEMICATADLDLDGDVDFDDLLVVLSAWPDNDPAGDADCDGQVTFDDLLMVLSEWTG